jgi:phosphatidylserine decarboxylase
VIFRLEKAKSMTQPKAIKREQMRQALQIHGGIWPLLIARLGIKLARLRLPNRRLRASLYRSIFSKKYPPGINEEEAEFPLGAYASLNAFFTRGIKPEFRPILNTSTQFLSPCDGVVQDVGSLQHDTLLTLKGTPYTLNSLLPNVQTSPFENGHYAIIFLSPLDCHRVFTPQEGLLLEAIHVPGFRLPVHPPCQRAEYPVYALNERMILRLETELGPCIVVMIAGWGVGNISLPAEREFRPRGEKVSSRIWPKPIAVKRGEWIATFELGSTAVLIVSPHVNLTTSVSADQRVKYGEPIFNWTR